MQKKKIGFLVRPRDRQFYLKGLHAMQRSPPPPPTVYPLLTPMSFGAVLATKNINIYINYMYNYIIYIIYIFKRYCNLVASEMQMFYGL